MESKYYMGIQSYFDDGVTPFVHQVHTKSINSGYIMPNFHTLP